MKKLLFLTTSTLAANPRLVKEFETLKHNYHCEVICFHHEDWTGKLSFQIEKRNPNVTFYNINRRDSFIDTICSKLIHKVANVLTPIFKHNLCLGAYASHDKTFQLERYTKKITKKTNYDVIIAHNLGAFYSAFKALPKKCRLHLDIEDFHPGEQTYFNPKYEIQNRILVMQQLLKKASTITYASPLIMKACLDLFDNANLIKAKSFVINNCFSQEEFQYNSTKSNKIKMVWFSQNIAKGRGLETIIPVLNEFATEIELHLIGNLYEDFNDQVLNKYKHFINIYPPMPQKDLNLHLALYDVGLAIEPGKDKNNKLALSNKIFSYFQTGLYILASSTPAQVQFLTKHNKNGILTDFTNSDLRLKIKSIVESRKEIRAKKLERFSYAKQFSWEVEQKKLLKIFSS